MAWFNIKEQLNKNLRLKGIEEKVQESLVIDLANNLMIEIWGIEIEKKARVIYFRNNILIIAILYKQIEEEFEFHKDNFIKHLNRKYIFNNFFPLTMY